MFVNKMDRYKNQLYKDLPSKSVPIKIPTKGKMIMNNQLNYSLKSNAFNPDNSSPPNSWNKRLMLRLYTIK
jgi:hypothetical protein